MKLFFSPSFNVAIFTLLLIVSGCSVYRVRSGAESPYNNVPGIPFYVKHAQCRHQTIYQEDVRRLGLEVLQLPRADMSNSSEQVVFSSSKHVLGSTAEDARSTLLAYLQGTFDDRQRHVLIQAFQELSPHNPQTWRSQSRDLMLVSNERAAVLQVDYSRPYYLNARRPVIGAANVSAELNPDGTLSKGSAEIDDRTMETLLSHIPIKEVLLSRWVPDDSQAFTRDEPVYRAVLTIEPALVLHTLTKIEPLEPICGPKAAVSPNMFNTGEVMYSRATAAVVAPAMPAAGNAISVSGQIMIPERKP